jgi:hypothetical protein
MVTFPFSTSRNLATSLTTQIAVPKIIDQDHDDIGLARRRSGRVPTENADWNLNRIFVGRLH